MGMKFLSDIKLESTNIGGASNHAGTWQFSGKEVDVDDWETSPEALWFKPDGTKMFVVGRSGDDINEFALSTAWDVETITFVANFYLGGSPSSETNPYGVYFSPDGTKFYIVGHTMDQVLQYSCSAAWDITTAAYVREQSLIDGAGVYSNPHGIFFKPDGTSFYVVSAVSDKIKQYTLSSAWDVSTLSEGDEFSLLSLFTFIPQDLAENTYGIGSSDDLFFSEDGKTIWIADAAHDAINELVLSTAWDITTATYNGRSARADRRYYGEIGGLYVSESNGTAYITGSSDDFVRELTISGVAFEDSKGGGVYFKNGVGVKDSLAVEGFLDANTIQVDTFNAYSTLSTFSTTRLAHGNGGTVDILDNGTYTGVGRLDIMTNTYWGANSTDLSIQDNYRHDINMMRPLGGARTYLNIGARVSGGVESKHSGIVKINSLAQEFTHSGF
jgi:DNA-binding beta-propeller fold protein YncE